MNGNTTKSWSVDYAAHSGFSVDTGEVILLFDYWKGKLPSFSPERKLYVFVSHWHADHFDPSIFRYAGREGGVVFVLSSDLKEHRKTKLQVQEAGLLKEEVLWVSPNEHYEVKGLGNIDTLRSTDEGVAFLVTLPSSHTIYHAGDLHWWLWDGEPKDWLNNMEANYKRAVNKLQNMAIDVAFLVLDDRLEGNFAAGMEYFLHTCRVKYTFPMHFWEDRSVIKRYPKEALYGTILENTADEIHWTIVPGM